MVREHQSYRHKTHEFLHVNKDILQQKQGYRATEKGLSYNEKSKKEGQCPRGNCPFAL